MTIRIEKYIEIRKWKHPICVIITLLIMMVHNFSFSQDNGDELFYVAENYIDNENFDGAINLYQRILDENPDNAEINFKLGFCYLNSIDKKEKAIEYIEKSLKKAGRRQKKSNEFLIWSYYLARAYQSNYNFSEALIHYNTLKELTNNKQMLSLIDKEIKRCIEGKDLITNPLNINITNLGDSINSEYSDHSPVISADESVLIFTSRRKGILNQETDYSGEYDENIYISYKNNETWTTPVSVGKNINTAVHEASIGLSVDGQQLLIYKSDEEGSIYYSKLKGDEWQVPEKFGNNINTKSRETDACFSPNGNTIYFTSDRKGGMGGLDIYESYRLINGEWSEPKNLGPTINSSEDERAPFMHPDGITLYFSSRGHGGLGGFDIFKSELNSFKTWSEPFNIGYPINTSSDDVFYITSADNKHSYYASNKETGFGKTDIYIIGQEKVKAPKITIMTGKVHICHGTLPEVSITVLKYENDSVVGIYAPNSKTGKFLFVLNRGGRYKVIFETNGKIINEEQLTVLENAAYQQLYKVVEIPADPPCNDDEISKIKQMEFTGGVNIDNIDENGILYDASLKVENILFPPNQSQLTEENKSLNNLAEFLSNNPKAQIEIGAYADASGKAAYNYKLSMLRGEAIKDYLVRRKAKPEQLIVISYGEENPIALNKNTDGSWNKEGQNYNRRIEFRVIKQGKQSLLVKPISDIPQNLINNKYKYNYKKSPTEHLEIDY